MRILQLGFQKSGNYWLWNILRRVLQHSQPEVRSFIHGQPIYRVAKRWDLSTPDQVEIDFLHFDRTGFHYVIMPVFAFPIDDIGKYVRQTSLVWSHSSFDNRQFARLARHFDRIVYIVRDPRDALLSSADFRLTPFQRRYYGFDDRSAAVALDRAAEGFAGNWVAHVAPYLLHRHRFRIHLVYYERLVAGFDDELASLLRYLGITLTQAAKDRIRCEVSLGAMRAHSPGHVSRGQVGRWLSDLPNRHRRSVSIAAGPLMALLGYSRTSREYRALQAAGTQPRLWADRATERSLLHELDRLTAHLRMGEWYGPSS